MHHIEVEKSSFKWFKLCRCTTIGTNVSYLNDRSGFVPTDPSTVAVPYLTASASGRGAAQTFIESILASGLDKNFNLLYPSDRGLGNEGYPTESNEKLSDNVRIWAPNDIDLEVNKAQGGY